MKRLIVLLLGTILALGVNAASCSGGDQLECASSLCPNYAYVNNTCTFIFGRTCITGQTFLNNTCYTCQFTSKNDCSVICPDHLWMTINGKTSCHACYNLFGAYCIRCNQNYCLGCSFTSGTTLSSDRRACIVQSCHVSNCIQCYGGGSRCYRCSSGYSVSASFNCLVATCNIANCMTCKSSTCGICFPGYSLSSNQLDCQPICQDLYCTTCLAPNICGACLTGYFSVIQGVCRLDATLISIPNCIVATSLASCSVCSTGFTAIQGGNYCQFNCLVTDCELCPSNPQICLACVAGYQLTNSSNCTAHICLIPYCLNCSSATTCSGCLSGFILSGNGTICEANCAVGNCLLCTGSTCRVCLPNYILNGGACVLPCASIANCQACLTSTLCASCAPGYQLSTDHKNCNMVCLVPGCWVCSSITSQACLTCHFGYIMYNDPVTGLNRCVKQCPEGTTPLTFSTCLQCSTAILQCQKCNIKSNTVYCQKCLTGYFLNGPTCQSCFSAIFQCIVCQSANRCLMCANGYNNINGICDNGVCDASVTNCKACVSPLNTTCAICNNEYIIFANVCTQVTCADSFVFDEESGTCLCPAGTYQSSVVNQRVCLACPDNCNNCTSIVCHSCIDEYFNVGWSCLPCADNCKQCRTTSWCQTCLDGYSLNYSGQCISYVMTGTLTLNGVNIVRCEAGCQKCGGSPDNNLGTRCLEAADGYSIVGGLVLKCHPTCRSCVAYINSLCTACYPGSILKGGTCISCGDANALTCSAINIFYALTCKNGYTAGFFHRSVFFNGGNCQPCALFCRSCLSNGPAKCDANGCIEGTVQLTGTLNCTKCFGDCVRCSPEDPNQCLSCGQGRFLNASISNCQLCPTGCVSCLSTACHSCSHGYYLINSQCVLLPAFCVKLDSMANCIQCFGGYALGNNKCIADISCNQNHNCLICPQGYFLTAGTLCTFCQTYQDLNCLQCSVGNSSDCIKCVQGFYLDSAHMCQSCPSSCLSCISSQFCTKTALGYYLLRSNDDSNTGMVGQCVANCESCLGQANNCLSCVANYTIQGTNCVQDFHMVVNMILGPSASHSIINFTDPLRKQLSDTVRSINRICNSLVSILPEAFVPGNWSSCSEMISIRSVRTGSVYVSMTINGGSNNDVATASNDLSNALASGNLDGMTILSSSVSAVGTPSSTSNTTPNNTTPNNTTPNNTTPNNTTPNNTTPNNTTPNNTTPNNTTPNNTTPNNTTTNNTTPNNTTPNNTTPNNTTPNNTTPNNTTPNNTTPNNTTPNNTTPNNTTPNNTTPSTTSEESSEGSSIIVILAIAVPLGLIVILTLIFIIKFTCCKQNQQTTRNQRYQMDERIQSAGYIGQTRM